MKELSINDISYATVDFSVNKMLSAKTVWVNRNSLNLVIPSSKDMSEEMLYDLFKDNFAYGILGNDKFDEIQFDLHDTKTLKAERYGGMGITDNAGGVRCGNLNNFQIKGVGQNCLVGSGKDGWHSYGCLSLLEGICEAINSVVFNHILPVGTAKCYGLICTGNNTSCPPSEKGKAETGFGALLIREVCLRPAHFYRCNFYQDKKYSENKFVGDVFRTRQVNIQLRRHFKEDHELILALGEFLVNCANQFAFARVFRIMHGAITPSNISFDGRWLDLTTATFVSAGENYASSTRNTPFYSESEDVIVILEEFLYNYGKYTLQDFNIAPLASYYWEQFNAYLRIYVAEALGFSKEESERVVGNVFFDEIYQAFLNEVLKSDGVKIGFPTYYEFNDPLLQFVECAFKSLSSDLVKNCKSTFCEFVKNIFVLEEKNNFHSKIVKLMIRSLRKIYFTPIFFRGNIINDVRTTLNATGLEDVSNIIKEYETVSHWLFEGLDTDNNVILLNSQEMKILFNVESGFFYINKNDLDGALIFKNSIDVKKYIESIESRKLRVNGFFLKESLIRIVDVLVEVDAIKNIDSNTF